MTPPTDPLHRRLWLMGFDEEQREALIRFGRAKVAAGLDADLIGFAQALARMQPRALDKLEVETTERKDLCPNGVNT
jgi:hypothetical protein